MVEILAYAFGIMYTPGPVNLISLNAGLNGQVRSTVHFCVGVACAMFLLFLAFAYTGAWLVKPAYQLWISCAGSVYIAYLAYKISWSSAGSAPLDSAEAAGTAAGKLSFKSGLIMQLLNPKAFVAILPIVSVQFPAAQISGAAIVAWSLLLSSLALGAPATYLLMGARLGKWITQPSYFRWLNLSMSILLLYVAGDIFYNHVFLNW